MFNNPGLGELTNGQFKVAVRLGLVPGWSIYRKFGHNDAVVSGSQEMWVPGTPRVLPTAAALVIATSTSAQDDIVAITGTGAWVMFLEGLDANGAPITDTISMRGAVNAFSTKSFYRLNRAYALTGGTGRVNAGTVSLTIGGDLQAYIEAGAGQTHQTHYTVPTGYTVVVDSFHENVGRMGGTADLHIESRILLASTNACWRSIDDTYLYQNTYDNDADIHLLPAGTEVKQVIVSTSTTQASATWGGFLIDNRYLPDGWVLDGLA